MNPKKTEAQAYAELVERHEQLSTKKVRVETQLENARNRLAELQRQAKSQFGTDDLDALRAKLTEIKEENERRRSEYTKLLDSIEDGLRQAAQAYESVEGTQNRPGARKGM